MSALSLPLRLATRARRDGLGRTLAKLFADHVYRRSSSVILEHRREWTEHDRPVVLPEGYGFVLVRPGDALPPLGPWLAPRRAAFEAMLAEGKVAVFASSEEGAIACGWAALSDHRDRKSREFYRVAPGEAYLYCWLVAPAYRRAPIAQPLCRFLNASLARRGIERKFVVVDRVNKPSYLIQQRLGFRECGVEVIHLYALHTRWTWQRRYTGTLGLLPHAGRT